MPAACLKSLPIVNLPGHSLDALPATKLFIRVPRQPNIYVVSALHLPPSGQLSTYLVPDKAAQCVRQHPQLPHLPPLQFVKLNETPNVKPFFLWFFLV